MVMYDEESGQYMSDEGELLVVEPLSLGGVFDSIGDALGGAGDAVADFLGSGVGQAAAGAVGNVVGGPIGGILGQAGAQAAGDAGGVGGLLANVLGGPAGGANFGWVSDMFGGSGGGQAGQRQHGLQGEWQQYQIQPGDTLGAIAQRFGTTVQQLAQVNQIQDPDRIYAGQTIAVPLTDRRGSPSPSPQPTGGVDPVHYPQPSEPFPQPPVQPTPPQNGGGSYQPPAGGSQCLPGQQPAVLTINGNQVQYCRPVGPYGGAGGGAQQADWSFDLADDVHLPTLPGNAEALAKQVLSALLTTGMAKQIIEWLAKRTGVKRGRGAEMSAACVKELTKQLPSAKRDALRQFLCDFGGPMNLSKDGHETFLALKIAASGYSAQKCGCDD